MNDDIFLDTSYIIALTITNDQHYYEALNLSRKLKTVSAKLITTELILIEIADALSKLRFRSQSILAVKNIRKIAKIISFDKDLLLSAWDLYEKRLDKEWGLTDCYSFVVMKKHNIKQALTTDKHFEQAGFEILLK